MATKTKINPRQKALDGISTKIATFVMTETYNDERDAQQLLSEAIGKIDEAVKILVANDEKAEAETK